MSIITSAVSLSDVIAAGLEQPKIKVTRLANASHLTVRRGLRMRGFKMGERKRSGFRRYGSEGKKNRMVRVFPNRAKA